MHARLPVQVPEAVRVITTRAWALLTVMTLLLLAAAGAVLYAVSGLEEEADALERVGAQRMMAQRSTVLATQLAQADLPAQLRSRIQDELEVVAERMRGDARWLMDNPDVPPEVATLYATAWLDEAGVMSRFHQNLRQILDGRGDVASLNHREAMLFNEEAARRYKRHAGDEYAQLRLVAVVAFITLVAGLAGLFLTVLRPGIALLQQQVMRQTALGDAIVQSGHGVLMVDGSGKIGFANAAAEALTGYDAEHLLGQELGGLIFSGYGGGADSILERAFHTSWRGDVRLIRRGGVMSWAEMVVSASPIEGKYLVILFDASERREAQVKLRQARERLFSAIEAVDDGFALFDSEERLLTCNRRFVGLFPQLEPWLVPGTAYPDIVARMAKLEVVEGCQDHDGFVATRLALFRAAQGDSEIRLADGRVLRWTDRRTPEGGRVSVAADVTESIQSRDQLRLALSQSEAALKAKAAFLSSMSHELRTPLNAIVGFSQLLEATPDGQFGPKQRRSATHILAAGRRLTEMVDQVLELAELQDGKGGVTIAPFDLAAVAHDGIQSMAKVLAEAGLEVAVSGCDAPAPALGDANRVAEILRHLLSNAAKYSHAGGRVELGLTRTQTGHWRLAVGDNGPGLSPEAQEHLFKPFGRLGLEEGGIGIGLAISRILVERMAGRIGVNSTPGLGSVFWIELPGSGQPGLKLAEAVTFPANRSW